MRAIDRSVLCEAGPGDEGTISDARQRAVSDHRDNR